MICVSIASEGLDACMKALDGVDFAEIRLDKTKLSDEEVKKVFSLPKKLIATFRENNIASEDERKRALMIAIDAGASMVDVELEGREEYRKEIVEKAKEKGCSIIISHHDYDKTPQREELLRIVDNCFEKGADIAKVACKANSVQDSARLLGLLDSEKKLVVIAMGEYGRITRVAGPLLGSQFTFASQSSGKETAPGQLERKTMEELLKTIEGS